MNHISSLQDLHPAIRSLAAEEKDDNLVIRFSDGDSDSEGEEQSWRVDRSEKYGSSREKYKWDFCKPITCTFFIDGYNNIATNPRDAGANGYGAEAVSCISYNHVKCSASPWGEFYGVWRGSTSTIIL